LEVAPKIMAPVSEGDVLGRINVTLEGEPVASVDLVALKEISDDNLWQQLRDSALLWLE
jgi:D-alanyl-D-alanine carboxypeptidase (penicillin-binding protein 5/6)